VAVTGVKDIGNIRGCLLLLRIVVTIAVSVFKAGAAPGGNRGASHP